MKIFLTIVFSSTLFLLLSACGSGDSGTNSTPQMTESQPQAAADKAAADKAAADKAAADKAAAARLLLRLPLIKPLLI